MDRRELVIDEDITRAETPPGWFYTDAEAWESARRRIFERTWHCIGDTDQVSVPRMVAPFTLLPGCLDEPLVLTRDDDDQVHCLSNVCTHRGNLVAEHGGKSSCLTCRYHGRRFHLDGRFRSMPEFEGVKDFPSRRDNLSPAPLARWHQFLFAGVNPAMDFDAVVREMEERVGWLPIEQAQLDPSRSRDYLVQANWALYCDNYLEGLHIPFVHESLDAVLDYGAYETEALEWGVLQLGLCRGGEAVFDIPAGSPDHGRRIGAYYYWLYPGVMFNIYPWGISLNLVQPMGPALTRVLFRSYVWDATRLEQGAGAGLDRVEREDEAVVEAAHRGLRSRFYQRGRYSPTREQGVHRFHLLLARQWRDGAPA
ncbi:MAG: aromatic ring-hydroxylating dioxygenase subunit alpha [Phycisphaerales bacterium]|nr:aromatic ring-hydroxylating dioxygenase subunit alpha [Phycisphaerales bacterium]